MIVEGKHAEVGHGIFISDIQEGSVADQVRNDYLFWNYVANLESIYMCIVHRLPFPKMIEVIERQPKKYVLNCCNYRVVCVQLNVCLFSYKLELSITAKKKLD